MAKLLRESAWKKFKQGDVFRVPGIHGRRFTFQAHVTNFENGATHIEAIDTRDGKFRAFDPSRKIVRDNKATQARKSEA